MINFQLVIHIFLSSASQNKAFKLIYISSSNILVKFELLHPESISEHTGTHVLELSDFHKLLHHKVVAPLHHRVVVFLPGLD